MPPATSSFISSLKNYNENKRLTTLLHLQGVSFREALIAGNSVAWSAASLKLTSAISLFYKRSFMVQAACIKNLPL